MQWAELRPFVDSLRATSFDGEIRFFVAGLDAETSRRLQGQGVSLHRFRRLRLERDGRIFHAYDPPLSRFRSNRITRLYPPAIRTLGLVGIDRASARARLSAPLSIPHVSRYYHYYRYLSRRAGHYENVMLTDLRDVFFQRDPFAFQIGKVHCFLEYEGETLGSHKGNRQWLRGVYGDNVLRRLADLPISCSGVTIGPVDGMLRYLRAMVNDLVSVPFQWAGVDQGVHNYVVHTGLAGDIAFAGNDRGPVATLAAVPKADVEAALPDGYAHVNVIHQYDRHPLLAEMLLRRLGADMNSGSTVAAA
jgi:hypothetical protein